MAFFDRFMNKSPVVNAEEQEVMEAFLSELEVSDEESSEDIEQASVFQDEWKADIRKYIREDSGQDDPDAIDAFTKVYVEPNHMTAFMCVFAPQYGGDQITVAKIQEELRYEGISFGIQTEILERIEKERLYYRLVVVARGRAPQNGMDGSVQECLERRETVSLEANERNVVDFKTPEFYQSIKKGDIICRITPAEKGQDGIDVFGRGIPSTDGKDIVISKGKNTAFNEEGTALVASIDGSVSYENSSFVVDEMMLVDGDADAARGDVFFEGDILIKGDVSDGIEIHSVGNVVICGSVKEANIHAGGTIRVQNGVDGKGSTVLKAGKEIQSSFLENVKAEAHGNIYADAVNNATLTSGHSIYVKGGKGIIIGGCIRAAKYVEAKRIGNQSGCRNEFILAYTEDDDDNVEMLEAEGKKTEEVLRKVARHVSSTKSLPHISHEMEDTLKSLEQQKVLYEAKMKLITQKVQKIQDSWYGCSVKSEVIYPLTSIKIGSTEMVVKNEVANCNIRYSQGNLIKETYNMK